MSTTTRRTGAILIAVVSLVGTTRVRAQEPSADEVRTFMRQLAEYVRDHHLKRADDSPQRGVIYEYYDVSHAGRDDAWIEGEALDSMHDGAWFVAALAQAQRATGGPLYRELLVKWALPFYVHTLNHSDELFDPACNAGPSENDPGWAKEHLLVTREKGFLPYFWDDGASVSLEAERRRSGKPPYPACDLLAGQPNPQHRLKGYALGSSNHLAQDLGVMLLESWLLLRDSPDAAERQLAAETAEAARNLAQSRMKRFGPIPAVMAAVASFDLEARKSIPENKTWKPENHYTHALVDFKPGQKVSTPGFADDQEYAYFAAIARSGGTLPKPVAQKLVYDALTQPQLYRFWSDDAEVPPGMNRFDLYPFDYQDGKPTSYRSDRPMPAGSRFGPQNLVVCGWALQALKADPGLYEERFREQFADDGWVMVREDCTRRPEKPETRESLPQQIAMFHLEKLGFRFDSDPVRMRISLTWARPPAEFSFRVHGQPDGRGSYAEIRRTEKQSKGKWSAVNDRGESLQLSGGDVFSSGVFTVSIVNLPFTAVKGQNAWANGIEHGRMSVSVGDQTRNLYLMSPEAEVEKALRRELAGGIRTWMKVFREKGFIPTSIGASAVADRRWDDLSDTGGYAHLISACAQYLFLLEGKTDWESKHFPAD